MDFQAVKDNAYTLDSSDSYLLQPLLFSRLVAICYFLFKELVILQFMEN